MVATKQSAQTTDEAHRQRQRHNQDTDEPTTSSAAANAHRTNPPSGSAPSSATEESATAASFVIGSNVDTRNLGPGAFHVVPRGILGTGQGNDHGDGDEATTDAVVNATDVEDDDDDDDAAHDIVVTATLVVEEDDDHTDAGADAHDAEAPPPDADTDAGGAAASSSQPSSSTRHPSASATTVSSTLIAHATPVGSVHTGSLYDDDNDDDGPTGRHSEDRHSEDTNHNRNNDHNHNNHNDEEAPVLSLVDQRVVDEHISQLRGEHRRSLKRRTAVGAVLVFLAVIAVVAVTVPVVSTQRGGDGDGDADEAMMSSEGSRGPEPQPLVGSCAIAELNRRRWESSSSSSSNSTTEEEETTNNEDYGNPYEYYGMWSAISGSTVVVGSPGTEGPGPDGKVHRLGRVHLFEGRPSQVPKEDEVEDEGESEWTWEEIPTGPLEPAERVTEYGLVASFGFRVTLSDDVLAVTSFTDKAGFPGVGMVYVYRRNDAEEEDASWAEEAILAPPEDAMDDDVAMAVFGALVAVSGDAMAVASVLRGNAKGAVYVYRRVVDANNGTVTWQEDAKLEASDGREGDEFGSSLAMDGNTIVASSVWASNDDGDIVGKAYVFSKNDEGLWVETDILTASDAQPNSEFGYFVAIVGNTIAVSAPFFSRGDEEDPNGRVYIYKYDGADAISGGNSTWSETFMLSADDASEFGGSLSMHGEYIVVGAPSAPVGGGIYLYGLQGDDWKLEKKFQYPDTVGFGRSVGISEQAVVVTDPIFTRSGMAQSGAAFVVDYLQSNKTLC